MPRLGVIGHEHLLCIVERSRRDRGVGETEVHQWKSEVCAVASDGDVTCTDLVELGGVWHPVEDFEGTQLQSVLP